MKRAYYNDNDPAAAAQLRELVHQGLIAPGDVDTRSIKDIRGRDLDGYDQCHFFAGIGIWSAALREAGWPDERPVWTGSCPCQPFSGAGKGLGFDDPRHLWPEWFRLIAERRPHTIFGEQVARAGAWVDLVRTDLESVGAAFGCPDLPAAGFAQGAHRRQRFDWVADLHHAERWSDLAGRHFGDWPQAGRVQGHGESGAGREIGGMEHANLPKPRSESGDHGEVPSFQKGQRTKLRSALSGGGGGGEASGLGHHHQGLAVGSRAPDEHGAVRIEGPAFGATGSLRGCDWLLCHDARIRPVEAGTFPLAASDPGRLGLLRGYGNALDFAQTVAFIECYMEAELFS